MFEFQRRTAQIFHRDIVNHDLTAMIAENMVVVGDYVIHIHFILKAGASAPFDHQAQEVIIAKRLVGGNLFNAHGRFVRHGENRLCHKGNIEPVWSFRQLLFIDLWG